MTSDKAQGKTWSQLKVSGNQPATKIERHLVALAAEDSERWDHIAELTCLYDEGKLYSAAPKAVSELCELLNRSNTPNKDTILALLGSIVCGSQVTRMVWGLDLRREEIKEFYARGTARQVWKATWKHRETYVKLLGSGDAQVRSAAAFVLAFDYEGAAEVLPEVERRAVSETEAKTRASQLLSVGLLRSYVASYEPLLDLEKVVEDPLEDLLVRGAAVVAQLYASKEPVTLTALQFDLLVQWCELSEVDADGYPWNNGVTDMHCTRVVEGRCVDGGLVGAEILAEAIRRYGPHRRGEEWSTGILELAFKRGERVLTAGPYVIDAGIYHASMFSERERGLLEVLSSYSFNAPFLSRGIPAEVYDRRRWLGLEPPGPMEREVELEEDGKRRKWPVWLHLKAQQAKEQDKPVDVERVLGRVLTPTQLLEVELEYTRNAYSLRLGVRVAQKVLDRGAEMIPWAIDYLKYMGRIFNEFGGTCNGGARESITAMRLLIQEGRADELLPEYDILIHPSWGEIIAELPLARREKFVSSRLRATLLNDAREMWVSGVRGLVESTLKNLDLYSTEIVANTLFDLRDHIVLRRFTEFSDVCTAIEEESVKVDASHGAFHEVVKRRLARSN